MLVALLSLPLDFEDSDEFEDERDEELENEGLLDLFVYLVESNIKAQMIKYCVPNSAEREHPALLKSFTSLLAVVRAIIIA